MANKRVFVDSSVLISALLSEKGGSFYILTQLYDKVDLMVNRYTIDEVLDVLLRKQILLRTRFLEILASSSVIVLDNPTKVEVEKLSGIIEKEDAPILASALFACDFLVTLDNDFLDQQVTEHVNLYNLSIVKPKELIEIFR